MLDLALLFLTGELNNYFLTQTGSEAVKVEMCHVVDETGKYACALSSVGATIINIEEERTVKEHLPEYQNINGQHAVLNPKLKLNFYVMFTANFKVYQEALKYISLVMTFFQGRLYFTPEIYPALDPRLEKLVVELQSLTYEQLNQIWAYLGGKHLPSVVYKIRLVSLQEQVRKSIQPPLQEIKTDLHRR